MFSGKSEHEKLKLRIASARRLMGYNYKVRSGQYRSKLEKQFADLLDERKIPFTHEPAVTSVNGKIYFPDFQVRRTYIEISGFAYKAWQDAFTRKLRTLSKTHPHLHVVVPDNVLSLAQKRLSRYARVWPCSKMSSLANYLE